MSRAWQLALARRLPQALLSRAWGWLSRRRRPAWAVRLGQRAFARMVGCDLSEAQVPPGGFDSLEALFLRRLLPQRRPLAAAADAWLSPVDGQLGELGPIVDGQLMQVKGQAYDLATLLDDPAAAAGYRGGSFVTLYLAPRDYHHVHAPADCQVEASTYLPGRLLPVFVEALERVPRLLCHNERMVAHLLLPGGGRMAAVLVGATLVGRILLHYDRSLVGNRPGARRQHRSYAPPIVLERGGQLGAFALGSTVVLVASAEAGQPDALVPGQRLQVGQAIGRLRR